MGLDLPSGGHLTHGYYTFSKKEGTRKPISATSVYFESLPYTVSPVRQQNFMLAYAGPVCVDRWRWRESMPLIAPVAHHFGHHTVIYNYRLEWVARCRGDCTAKVVFSAAHVRPVISVYSQQETGLIDFDKLEEMASIFKPSMIICGGSAYPRDWDYARFRKIADANGALLMCDMAHISGLVATQEASNPFEVTMIHQSAFSGE